MKTRAISILLAIAAAFSLTLPGYASPVFAAAAGDGTAADAEPVSETETAAEPAPESAEPSEAPAPAEEPEPAPIQSDIHLNGMPVDPAEYALIGNVYYVTVRGFVSTLDPEAMIDEGNGVVTVSAVSYTTVADAGSGGQAQAVAEGLTLTANAGISYIVANGRYLYVPNGNRLVNGAIAVPVRTLAEVFNMDVSYDSASKTVQVTHQAGADAYLEEHWTYYSQDTLYWLSHIIRAESGNQPLEGMIAVGRVVLNRVASPAFPNNVYDVLFQPNQFSPVVSGTIYRDVSEIHLIAAKLAMDGADPVPGALFFNGAGARPFRNRTYLATIGGHAFYR